MLSDTPPTEASNEGEKGILMEGCFKTKTIIYSMIPILFFAPLLPLLSLQMSQINF